MSNATVIRGGRLVRPNNQKAEPADILVVGDTIAEIGPPGFSAPEGAAVLSAEDRLIIPGLVNAHTHSPQNITRSMGDRWTLELALNANPAIRGNMSTEEKYLAAQLGAAEMVSKGCTACYDLFYEFPFPTEDGLNAVAQAYVDVGMRAVVAPMMADRAFYQAVPGLIDVLPEALRRTIEGRPSLAPFEESLAVVRRTLRNWSFPRDLARLAVAPTIPAHCSDAFWIGAARLAREFGIGIQTHLAESKVQAISGLKLYGKTLTAHLDGLGVLGPDFTAAHGVWLDDDDMRRLSDAGSSVAHSPGANMRYGSGLAAVRRMRDAGVNVAVGTDSRGCSDNLNMFEAMRLASFVARIHGPDYKRWLTTSEVLEMGTVAGARALGFADSIGVLAPGFKADIVLLDAKNFNYVPLNNAVIQVVNAEDGTAVDKVMIGGRVVVDGGKVLTIDIDSLAAKAQRTIERLRSVNADAVELAARLEDVVGSFCSGLAQTPYHVHRFCGFPH